MTDPPAPPSRVAATLPEGLRDLPETLVARHYQKRPDLARRYGPAGRERCLEDARFHVGHLEQALALDDPQVFVEYVLWGRSVLARRNVPAEDLVENLALLRDLLEERLESSGGAALAVLDAGLAALDGDPDTPPDQLSGSGELEGLARDFLDLLLTGRRAEAAARVVAAADGGVLVRDLYLGVFQPVLREVGRLWQLNQIQVVHEHYCTAAVQLVMGHLYPRLFAGRRGERPRMVASCTPTELHEIGLRMVADFFETEGWDTYFVGAHVPRAQLLSLLVERRPALLALSASLPPHLGDLRETIHAVREVPELEDLHVMVGGRPFLRSPQLARRLGADSVARDAQAALSLAEKAFPAGRH